jgi:low affinity Fe/Cu permease
MILSMPKRKEGIRSDTRSNNVDCRHAGPEHAAFGVACAVIVVWGDPGPVFITRTRGSWSSTPARRLSPFDGVLIQRSQNKDSLAIHIKLNEIVAAPKARATADRWESLRG